MSTEGLKMRKIDLNNWKRKEHFEFFSGFEDPVFGIVSEVDCTRAYAVSKERQYSFFAYYMHRSMLAVDRTEELKYRIVDGSVVVFDEIHAGPTIGREDGTFGFSFLPFDRDFSKFSLSVKEEVEAVRNSTGLRRQVDGARKNVIYYSTLPWSTFSGLKHPSNQTDKEGIPKITFGKTFIRDERMIMPVSVHAHHGLVDGLHISKYLESFQQLLDEYTNAV